MTTKIIPTRRARGIRVATVCDLCKIHFSYVPSDTKTFDVRTGDQYEVGYYHHTVTDVKCPKCLFHRVVVASVEDAEKLAKAERTRAFNRANEDADRRY